MANRVTIDVEARFVDRVTAGMNAAAKSSDRLQKSAEKANKELDKLSKKNAKPKLGADDNAFTKKIRQAQSRADKLGRTKVSATLGAIDKASAKIGQITGAARAFGSKVFRGALSMSDKASSVIGSVTGAARSFAGRTFSAAVKIKDMATAPLRKIKESLFSIKTLVTAITAGMAAKQFVVNPINLADQYSGAKIGSTTLLGEAGGQDMMNKIDQFAKETPFKTSGVISNVQKMMAYGWDASRIISDMETIGDAAAATGKGDQGLESIVYALSEIRSKGKLSTQELNQLASAGIKAKAYLAEGLGYGTSDEGMMKLAKDLEGGAIGANQAIELILQGMKEFDGMMDKTANETVSGLWSQIEDTFEINIFRKWGQGLQDGAKAGFGSIVELLNSGEDALKNFGDLLYDTGKKISNWGAGKLEKFVENIKEITETDVFKNASFGDKIKLLWKGAIVDPLAEWWENGGQEKTATTAGKIGKWMGETLSSAILSILGVTDLLKDDGGLGEKGGMSVAQSFAKGFADGFDTTAVTDKLVEAIKNVWGALPTWAKFLIGSYGVGKAASGIGGVISGIGSIAGGISSVWGSTGGMAVDGTLIAGSGLRGLIGTTGLNNKFQGTGLLNILANTGYKLTGGAATSALSGGMAAAAGAGALTAGVGLLHVGSTAYKAYQGYKEGDDTKFRSNSAKAISTGVGIGAGALAGAKVGAAIGSVGGPAGTLIGAGLGTVVGWFAGDKIAKNIEAAKYESEEMKAAIKDSEMSAEELAMAMERAAKAKLDERFGDIELSIEEINTLAKNLVFGEQAKDMEKFANASAKAEESLAKFQTAASDMDRLSFDMSERAWKLEMGLEEKLSEDEIEQVKARVQSYIESAESVLSDQHYKLNAAIEVLLNPVEGEENTTYDQFISDGNTMYAKLQEQLDGLTEDLTAKYNLYLEDGVITVDEQGTLSRIQGKIAEIIEKVSNAETEASFEVQKLKFTMGDLSAESFQELQNSLQSQLETYQLEQEEALTLGISELKLELDEGTITQEQYDEKLKSLVDGYNSNIESMTAKVNQIELEGISEAFDGVATADAIKDAIEGVISDGKNPVDVTFDDINAHLELAEDALSEEDKTAFLDVMKEAIKSAATGENALKTTAEVDPTLNISEDSVVREDLQKELESQLEGEEGVKITPTIPVEPSAVLQEGAGEQLKSDMETTVSSYLTGENSINTTANVYAAAKMYGSEGCALSEEADKGRTSVKSAIDTSMTDPFSATANANITLNWKITNPSASVSLNSSGQSVTASIAATENYNGGIITGGPQLSWLDEENMGEAVIPFNPSRRTRALQLFAETGRRLGIQNHANGGIIGGESTPIVPYEGNISGGTGEQTIEINMGGVTIEIKADGRKPIAENIEDQEQEIAEKVAKIFKNVFSAQFANIPLRGGT